ncbi:MAG: hypothetical protein JHC95_14875 [Solirubrobacteraceae bacterium]|nr:hypothetical protein [Solirubrobacteraceae bacterium]
MASSWQQGKVLTGKSWHVVKANPGLLKWPVLSGVFAIPGVAVAGAGIVLLGDNTNVAGIALLVIGAYLAVFGGILGSAALVAGADQALRGEPIEGAFGRASSHLGAIAGWALIQTVVGWLLSALTNGGGGGNSGTAGAIIGILRLVLGSLLSTAWALITFFVLPLIILEGLSPVAAIKRSGHVFRERWGTQILGGVRIGAAVAIFGILPSIIVGGIGVYLIATVENGAGEAGGGVLLLAGIIGLSISLIISSAMRAIFGIVLLRWAETGEAVGDFTSDELVGAVRLKKGASLPASAPTGPATA